MYHNLVKIFKALVQSLLSWIGASIRFFLTTMGILWFTAYHAAGQDGPIPTSVERTIDGGYTFMRNGSPYYVRGAGGIEYIADVARFGGNSIRTWSHDNAKEILDEAHRHGITVMMGLFNWTEMDCDPSNIKQFITQFEGDGTFELQKMEVVPFAGSLRKKVSASWTPNGDLLFNLRVGDAIVTGASTPDSLILTGRFEDREPFVNTKQGTELWNGDALEVAFSAQPVTSKRPRTNFLFSDVHLGLSLGERPEVVNFRTGALIPVKRDILVDEGGAFTLVSWKLPWASLKREGWQLEGRYLLEVARDQGNAKGRTEQIRWNSGEAEGFHLNPGLWGELIVPKKQ